MARAGQELFVGLNDKGEEGVWRFPSNEYFDPESDEALFKWASGEPNNSDKYSDENCAVVYASLKLNDFPCHFTRHGLCEVKVYDC